MDVRPLRRALGSLRGRIRGLLAAHGAGRAALALAALLVVSFLMDLLLAPPRGVRAIHALLSLAALGWVLARFLVGPMRRTFPDEDLAQAVEARVPALQDRLVSALQWERLRADPECGESGPFMEAATAEAVERLRGVDAAALADGRATRRSLLAGAAAAAVCVTGALALPAETAVWARRSLLLSDEEWPRRTTLVVPGFDPDRPRVVTVGDDVSVAILVEGEIPRLVTVHYESIPGEAGGRTDRDERPALQSGEDPRSFVFVFHEIPGSFRFHVTGGDDDDGLPRFEVRALVPPALEAVTARLTFPERTGLPPETRGDGDLEVPAGTRIDLEMRATVPLASATLALPADTPPRALEVGGEDRRTLIASVTVAETCDWRVDMTGADGATSVPARNTRRITALPDPRPDVQLLHPYGRVHAVAEGRVPVKVRASDNYSLAALALEVRPGRSREPFAIPLAEFRSPVPEGGGATPRPAVKTAVRYHLLDLSQVATAAGGGLALDDEVALKAVARDNGDSTSSTEAVAVQITDATELLRRVSQRQTRIRADVTGIGRNVRTARDAAARALKAMEDGADLTAADRESMRGPQGLAGRAARDSAALLDSLGEVVTTYVWNRLLDNKVAAERAAALIDEWLRSDDGDPAVVFKPDLWRRLARARATREIDDPNILGALLEALGIADRLATGPATTLRESLTTLAAPAGETPPADAARAAVAAAEEALTLLRDLEVRLQDWESMHEILEKARAIRDLQRAIRERLEGTGGPPRGR